MRLKLNDLCLVFLGLMLVLTACSKDDSPLEQISDTLIKVKVVNAEGKLVSGAIVKMYDEKSYAAFGKDILAEPQQWKTTDKSGTVSFLIGAKDWFEGKRQRELMFVVTEIADLKNYRYWSKGGIVNAGKRHSFVIKLE